MPALPNRLSVPPRRAVPRLVVALTLFALLGLAPPTPAADHHESDEAARGRTGATTPGASRGDEASGKASDKAAKEARPKGLTAPHLARERAPDEFRVRLETTKGDVLIDVKRSWAPHGADRFYNLVKLGFYDDVAFFRVIPGFMAQFGMHGDPAVTRKWQRATIEDDPVVESNLRGYVSFAKTGRPNSRTTQLFINLADNPNLDAQGFAPFGRVVEGMEVVDAIFPIGEAAPRGRGPNQQRIRVGGNDYLRMSFPRLDYIERATIVE